MGHQTSSKSRIALADSIAMAMAMAVALPVVYSGAVHAQDIGECHYTSDGMASWKSLIRRQLGILDKENASRLAGIADDILDGQSHKLAEDLAGISPNTTLKLAGGDMDLLDLAVAACQSDIAKQLVSMGASVDGSKESTPLVTASAKGLDNLAEYLIQRGAHIDKPDANGMTALETAIRQRKIGPARVLLKYGSDPNRKLPNGATLLDIVSHSVDDEDRNFAIELRKHGAMSGLDVGGRVDAR